MRYLLDTNVVSELHRQAAAEAVRGWVRSQAVATLVISVITVMELEIGVRRVERRDREWVRSCAGGSNVAS